MSIQDGARRGRTREEMLEGAVRAFGKTGLERTTLQDIAREAGVTVPTLYAHFGSREEIVTELGEVLTEELAAVFGGGMPGGLNQLQKVEWLLGRMFSLTERRRELLTVFFSLASGRFTDSATHGVEAIQARLVRWLREEGFAPARDRRRAEELAVALLGLGEAFVQRWMQRGAKGPLVREAPRVASLFVHGASGR